MIHCRWQAGCVGGSGGGIEMCVVFFLGGGMCHSRWSSAEGAGTMRLDMGFGEKEGEVRICS